MQYTPEIVAQAYGSGSYTGSSYEGSLAGSGSNSGSNTGGGGTSGSNTGGGNTSGNTTSTGASTGTAQSSSGASLSNTGFDLALILTFACIIAFAALVIRFWKKPKVTKQ
jgi:hypothetical protein